MKFARVEKKQAIDETKKTICKTEKTSIETKLASIETMEPPTGRLASAFHLRHLRIMFSDGRRRGCAPRSGQRASAPAPDGRLARQWVSRTAGLNPKTRTSPSPCPGANECGRPRLLPASCPAVRRSRTQRFRQGGGLSIRVLQVQTCFSAGPTADRDARSPVTVPRLASKTTAIP